ncbi:MDR family MFS transporter [Demequina aestuarii]|uniref:MDR family MFS transporter n=1 Tax=Demequina aestuarii TaxID=327095 RepID=UPI00078276D0
MTVSHPTPTRDQVAAETPDRRQLLLMFIGLMTAMLLAALYQTIFATALPTIVGELDGVDRMLWVTTAYILAATVTMPIYGKLGDLYGRKGLFITAIGLFLAGSVVGGLAQDMDSLIVGRVIQGLGGGGLFVLAQAIIADVVPARERGRYMGVMGGVFAFATLAGPLLGGWFTESVGWRWVMWFNLPLGALAIASAVLFLKIPARPRAGRKIDVGGMVLLAIASTSLVLMTSFGGHQYAWGSPQIIGLIALTVLAAVAFVMVERRASEPVIPLSLFRRRNFVLPTAAGLLVGVGMFGTVGYMPTYLQMVAGVSATTAGLLMAPMMGAMLITSITAGRAVTRTGRYKILPIVGSVFIGAGLYLLSTLTADGALWHVCAYLAVLGTGLGLSMQILVLVVQNTFPVSMVGTATASNNYFRQIGASLGTAIVGALFTERLVRLLADRLPGGGGGLDGGTNSLTPALVQQLPDAVSDVIVGAYNDALTPVFLLMVPLSLVSFVLLLFVKEAPLATRIEREIDRDAPVPAEASAGPANRDPALVRSRPST